MSAPARWLELSVRAHQEAAETVAALLHKWGEGGIAIFQDHEQETVDHDPRPVGAWLTLTTYVPDTNALAARRDGLERDLWHLHAFHGDLVGELGTQWVAEEDWANAWKQFYTVLHIGERLVIKPRWQDYDPAPDEIVIALDPGMAFGTGTHPTTQLCLEALERLPVKGKNVLDVGTGSGILAIAAAALGVGRVDALDMDPIAVSAARDNVAQAGLAGAITVKEGSLPLSDPSLKYDVVLANITAQTLITLAPHLRAAIAPHGRLLACGIIDAKASEVLATFGAEGLTLLNRREAGDWVLLELEPP
ncbi:MAG: 50S ribosomal protein L11 methyltransferase [Chloroflexota bacterium]|nr:50S ribosomal protein L11 methyltransferase [Chloroflexota bacterium]